MKTINFLKVLKSSVIALSFVLISTVSLAADPPINKNLNKIIDSIQITMKEKYGYELSIDESLKQGCFNFFGELKGGGENYNSEVDAHIHKAAIIPLDFYQDVPFDFFNTLLVKTVESNPLYFKIYIPKKIWVEEIVDGDDCYFIIAID
jgi:hypothetical protein